MIVNEESKALCRGLYEVFPPEGHEVLGFSKDNVFAVRRKSDQAILVTVGWNGDLQPIPFTARHVWDTENIWFYPDLESLLHDLRDRSAA